MPDATNVLLLVNPRAGRVDDAAIGAVCRALPADVPVEVVTTPDVDAVPDVLDRLDGRLLLLMGGDGTLNVGIGALHRLGVLEGTEVGFVPSGTANAFARAMDLPLHAPSAAVAALRPGGRQIDLLVAEDGRVAVNDLHTGLGIPATRISRRLKPVLRQLAYPVANSTVGVTTGGWRIGVTVDGTPLVGEQERVLAVAIGNTDLIGDGTRLWPEARPDDGRADVLVVLAGSRLSRIKLGLAVRDGSHLGHGDVRSVQGSSIELTGDVPGHNADGELSPQAARSWTVVPAAWQLRGAR